MPAITRKPKYKLYKAGSVHLSNVPQAHVAANGCRQFFIICRTTSVKRLAYILGTTMGAMTFSGAEAWDNPVHEAVIPEGELDTIYYRVEVFEGTDNGWHKYVRSESLDKTNPL